MYQGPDEAENAEEEFDRIFVGGRPARRDPGALASRSQGRATGAAVWIVALLVATGLAAQ